MKIFNPNKLRRQVYERKEASFSYIRKLKKEIKMLKKWSRVYNYVCTYRWTI